MSSTKPLIMQATAGQNPPEEAWNLRQNAQALRESGPSLMAARKMTKTELLVDIKRIKVTLEYIYETAEKYPKKYKLTAEIRDTSAPKKKNKVTLKTMERDVRDEITNIDNFVKWLEQQT